MVKLKNGLMVKVYYDRVKVKGKIHNKGGTTTAQIVNKEGKVLHQGIAKCNSTDNFCRKDGRNRAVGRAISAMTRGLPIVDWAIETEIKNGK